MEKFDLGQHFLIDKEVLSQIIEISQIDSEDVILEIGGGTGILTKELAKKCKKLIVVEIDSELCKILAKVRNIQIFNSNILDIIDDLKFNKIVANIPYHISEPLMKKLLREDIESITFLVGEKFWRILDSKDKLSRMVSCFYKIENLKTVNPDSFNPRPRVKSSIILMKKKAIFDLSAKDIFLRKILLQKDKKIKNAVIFALMDLQSTTKRASKEKIAIVDLPENIGNKGILSISNTDFKKFLTLIEKLI